MNRLEQGMMFTLNICSRLLIGIRGMIQEVQEVICLSFQKRERFAFDELFTVDLNEE